MPVSSTPWWDSTLCRWQAAVLDPRRHPAVGPGAVAGTTVYRPDRLLVRTGNRAVDERLVRALTAATADIDCRLDFTGTSVQFVVAGGRQPDPFTVLRTVRRTGDAEVNAAIGLDHLMTMPEQVGGNPFAIGIGQPGLDQYGLAYQGRGPVNLVLPQPRRRPSRRQPRVVVLDTGMGDHPWFLSDPAVTTVRLSDRTIGPWIQAAPGTAGPGRSAPGGFGLVSSAMLGSLGSDAGHGTFIAGLLRQACPEAEIVALTIMGSDGVVPESTLVDGLSTVLQKQQEQPGWADALVLSLGYYTEDAHDLTYNATIKTILLDLARAGVAIFCAAGNDATDRPSYPAAFAADRAFTDDPAVIPLTSVGALNPNGTETAFSNFGSWVTATAVGVNVVSTAPVTADGSGRAADRPGGRRRRSALDPDNFTAGFASWSGTSFAAPVLAGRYLRSLRDRLIAVDQPSRRQLVLSLRSSS